MQNLIDLDSFLPGSDWQHLETWAAVAGMTPLDYLKVCVRRGHALVREELLTEGSIEIRPIVDEPKMNQG